MKKESGKKKNAATKVVVPKRNLNQNLLMKVKRKRKHEEKEASLPSQK